MSFLEIVVWMAESVRWEDAVFWGSCVLAAPIWGAATFFPKAKLTCVAFKHCMLLALPFAIAFTVLVLQRLEWWLTRFVTPQLSLRYLTESFAEQSAFLLLWLYILGFDIAVFGWMHQRLMERKAPAFEMTVWALVTALCAPLGLAGFTALHYAAPVTQEEPDQQDSQQEKAIQKQQGSKAQAEHRETKKHS